MEKSKNNIKLDDINKTESTKKSFSEKIFHFIKFSSVSIICTLSEYVLFYFLTPFLCKMINQSLAEGISTAICYILATVACFFLNKHLVFKSKNNGLKEAIKFFAIATPKMLITTFLVPLIIFLLKIDLNILKTLTNVVIQVILFFLGYVFQKIWVFKDCK